MSRTALSLVALRHLRAPSLGGVRLSSSEAASPNSKPDVYVHSEEEAKELFESWCKKYKRAYSSEEEKQFRFGNFKETLAFVTRRNADFDEPISKCFGTNKFADWSDEEKRRLCGLR